MSLAKKLVIEKDGKKVQVKLIIKKKFSFDCPAFCEYSQKCDLHLEKCIYDDKKEKKPYCAFYNFYLLGKGRFSV
jgi:hypothetical protein